jgi:hypothetical protein
MNVWNWGADWSSDGTKLLFTRTVHSLDYSSNEYSIVTINPDGSNQLVVAGPTSQVFMEAMWSPDGRKIVMDGGARWSGNAPYPSDATGVLYVMNADGTNLVQISDNSLFRFHPSWQPIPVQSPDFTDTGNDVTVQPVDPTTGDSPVEIVFDSISAAGETTVTSSTSGPPPTSGYQLGDQPIFYDLSTTASFSGTITLCFSWTEGQFENESVIALFHYENDAWLNITTSLDTTANEVCGETTSLSPFAVFERSSYQFTGFFSPVDNSPTRNQVKAGSAVPVKFALGGDYGTNIFDPGYPGSQSVQCDTNAPIDEVEEIVQAGQSSLTYDPSTNQYMYVWKTNSAWKNQCRRLILNFNDGSVRTAEFKFK